MKNLNLLISQDERRILKSQNKKNQWLTIGIAVWIVYLVVAAIQLELAFNEVQDLNQEITLLKGQSSNRELNSDIQTLQARIKAYEQIEKSNAGKKQLIGEILRLANRANIDNIEAQTIANNIELKIGLTLRENQNSSALIEEIKQNPAFNSVRIISSNNINGIKKIELILLSSLN